MPINNDVPSDATVVEGIGPSPMMIQVSLQRLQDQIVEAEALLTLWNAGEKNRAKTTSTVKDKKGQVLRVVKIEELPVSQQVNEVAYGEYVTKPYDQTRLAQLTEYNQMLKSCIEAAASNSTLLGLTVNPAMYPHKKIADLTDQEKESFDEQKLSLLTWTRSKMAAETSPEEMSYRLGLALNGIGEGYIEVVRQMNGIVSKFLFANPTKIWVGKAHDRFIQMNVGKKAYFKPYRNPFSAEPAVPRRALDFKTAEEAGVKEGIALKDQATELIHFQQYNLVSDSYGVPSWTPSIPAILGSRAAEERNETFFQNDAVPRMAVIISGGALTDATVRRVQGFFKQDHKGVVNSNRVLILEVSAQNTNQPDWKPPVVQLKPLTVGKIDDASFLSYLAANKEQLREAFRIAGIFLGSGGDVNRAAAYTLREMTVNLVFAILGQQISNVFNKTLLYEWAYETKVKPEDIEVEYGFILPKTMSQTDEATIKQKYATVGALTPNDLRADLGLARIDTEWANIPSALVIVFAQMGLFGNPEPATTPTDDTTKAKSMLEGMRRALEPFLVTNTQREARLQKAVSDFQNSVVITEEQEGEED
jgi:capsid portal protein